MRNRNVSFAEHRAGTIPPDDLPADAVIDSDRRQTGMKPAITSGNRSSKNYLKWIPDHEDPQGGKQ